MPLTTNFKKLEQNLTPFGYVPDEFLPRVVTCGGIKWDFKYGAYVILSEEREGEFILRNKNNVIIREIDGTPVKKRQVISRTFRYYELKESFDRVDSKYKLLPAAKHPTSEKLWAEAFQDYDTQKSDNLPDL